jgi:hypothetical protein
MSTEEELTVIGRLVKDTAESKRRVALLESRLKELSAALTKAGGQINGLLNAVSYADLEASLAAIPTAESVLTAYRDFLQEKKRYAELSERVKSLGI